MYTAPLAVSRYVLDLKVPGVSLLTQEIADFVSGQIIGVLVGMAFRWWAFRRFVFPHEDVRRQVPRTAREPSRRRGPVDPRPRQRGVAAGRGRPSRRRRGPPAGRS